MKPWKRNEKPRTWKCIWLYFWIELFYKTIHPCKYKKKEEGDKKSIQEIEKTRYFAEKLDEFSKEVIDGLFKDLEHKKVECPYVELQVQDARTIERETKKENENFFDLYKNI